MFRMWVYHETKEPMIINSDELEVYLNKGWAETPAQFIKLEDLGLNKDKIEEPEEQAKAQQAYDAVDGVARSINNALNIDVMGKDELKDYISTHFNKELKSKRIDYMRKEAKKIAGV